MFFVQAYFLSLENHNSIAVSENGIKGSDPTMLQTFANKLNFDIRFLMSMTGFLGVVDMVRNTMRLIQISEKNVYVFSPTIET